VEIMPDFSTMLLVYLRAPVKGFFAEIGNVLVFHVDVSSWRRRTLLGRRRTTCMSAWLRHFPLPDTGKSYKRVVQIGNAALVCLPVLFTVWTPAGDSPIPRSTRHHSPSGALRVSCRLRLGTKVCSRYTNKLLLPDANYTSTCA